jgi:flagellar export protein FliJ
MTSPSKLERLLDLRRHEEERRAVELAMARQAVRDAELALTKLEAQRGAAEDALKRLHGESVGEVKTLRLLIEQLDQGIHNANTVRALAAATVVEKEQMVIEAGRRVETLERVIVPRNEQLRALERIAEQKLDDEAALARFQARTRNAS